MTEPLLELQSSVTGILAVSSPVNEGKWDAERGDNIFRYNFRGTSGWAFTVYPLWKWNVGAEIKIDVNFTSNKAKLQYKKDNRTYKKKGKTQRMPFTFIKKESGVVAGYFIAKRNLPPPFDKIDQLRFELNILGTEKKKEKKKEEKKEDDDGRNRAMLF